VRILRGIGRGLAAGGRGGRRLVGLSGRAGRVLGRGLRPAGRAFRPAGRGLRALAAAVRRRQVRYVLAWSVAVIAAVVAFATSGTVYDTDRLGWGLMPFVGAIAGLPLGLIVVRPMTGLLVSIAAAVVLTETLPRVNQEAPWPWLVVQGLVILALLFATCARETPRRAVGAWLLTAGLFYWGCPYDVRAGWVVGVTSVAVIGLLAGRLVVTNRALVRQAEVSSAEKARRVVLEERARIARDLHDIVAHHMSLVVVQTETAGYRVPDLSDSARAELLSIGESARSALTETRALLAVLRQDGQQVEDAPQPGLTRIVELVDAAQRAGVRLDARLDADLDVLRPGVSLAGYRIAQEALANAARHAPGARVLLTVQRQPDGVRLRVVNGPMPGSEAGRPEVAAAGHGITGMRERAAAAGGRLDLGPTEDGGFAVELFLPAPGAEQSAGSSGRGAPGVDPPGAPALTPGEAGR
jgi:signal transduction histidine kinase